MAAKKKSPVKIWFSKYLVLKNPDGQKITKKDVEKNCRSHFDGDAGKFWEIARFVWSGPSGPTQRYHLTVYIKLRSRLPSPVTPNDVTVPKPPGISRP